MNCTPLHSYQMYTFFNFRKIVKGNEENYIILFVREARTSYLRMSTHRVGKHFKKCVWTKIPDRAKPSSLNYKAC